MRLRFLTMRLAAEKELNWDVATALDNGDFQTAISHFAKAWQLLAEIDEIWNLVPVGTPVEIRP
jgi:hypothetical protein